MTLKEIVAMWRDGRRVKREWVRAIRQDRIVLVVLKLDEGRYLRVDVDERHGLENIKRAFGAVDLAKSTILVELEAEGRQGPITKDSVN